MDRLKLNAQHKTLVDTDCYCLIHFCSYHASCGLALL